MSDNYKNDSKLEMYPPQPQPPTGPPSYNQAYPTLQGTHPDMQGSYPTPQGTYPTVPGSHPTSQGTYPSIPGSYPTTQGTYPTAPGSYPTTQGTYPTAPGSHPASQGTYPTVPGSHPTSQGTYPSVPVTYPMEKGGVQTVCSQCHNQVVTSVDSSLNGSAIGWIIYSIFCCWPFAFFVFCMDNFKTWKHNCPNCRKLLAEFTPQASGGTTCGLICAGITMPIFVVLYIMCKYFGLF